VLAEGTPVEGGFMDAGRAIEYEAESQRRRIDEDLHKKGVKDDSTKLRYDLVLPQMEESIAAVLTYGANKYTDQGYRDVPNNVERYYAALRRHINAWRRGENNDAESGLHHLAHAATNCLILMDVTGVYNEEEQSIDEDGNHAEQRHREDMCSHGNNQNRPIPSRF